MNKKEAISLITCIIIIAAGLILMTSCYEKGTLTRGDDNIDRVVRDSVPMRIVNTNKYTYYERTLDTIQIDSNTYQVNAVYCGYKVMSIVRVGTFKK